jgi:hypothetical protein
VKENLLIVEWLQQCPKQRVSYCCWALERRVIRAPDDMAAEADRRISQLAVRGAATAPAQGGAW